jgi:hypothetical protein
MQRIQAAHARGKGRTRYATAEYDNRRKAGHHKR